MWTMTDDEHEERSTTSYERERWGKCPVCEAPHGRVCHADIGVQLGVRLDGRRMADGEGAHLARLQRAPGSVPVIPSPIFTDTITTTTTIAFGFWERVRIALGWRVCVQTKVVALVDRTAPKIDQDPNPTIWDWHPWRRRNRTVGAIASAQ